MKRIYFTAVPLQSNFVLTVKPVNSANFNLSGKVQRAAFPIIPIIVDTALPDDEVIIVAVRQNNSEGQNLNRSLLQSEVDALGLPRCTIQDLIVPESQSKDILLDLFSRMIDCLKDNACYYACMTFGTKTYPVVLFSVLAYAEKIRQNTEIKGIYYQEIRRHPESAQPDEATIYDVTALFRLNSVVDTASTMQMDDPDGTMRRLLGL